MMELIVAFGAGILSFLSPCVLPLIPGYISYISGSSIDELTDFQKLNMFLDVDGKRMQTGNTEQMIFDIKTLVSYMSSCMSLHPGDICCTGTPPGVGENMKPPHFLKGGEEVILGIDKLGQKKHQVIPYKD